MKVIIQIPCYNESAQLSRTVGDLPRTLPGIDEVEYLVIDDGSTDKTAELASRLGVHHVIQLSDHCGLARAYARGLAESVRLGADIVVNTDGDNQYRAADIQHLIAPIRDGRADMVVGARPIEEISHFSFSKKMLQRLGSAVVRHLSNTAVADTTSGFRALSREAALRLNVFSSYTYTLETIIQAGRSGMRVIGVPVHTNAPLRPSRLISSQLGYIRRSVMTMLRIFMLYEPLRFFLYLGLVPFLTGCLIGARFTWFYLLGQGEGKVQSLILASILVLVGVQLFVLGLVADLISTNRRILEEIQYRERVSAGKEGGTGGTDSSGQRVRQVRDSESDRPPPVPKVRAEC